MARASVSLAPWLLLALAACGSDGAVDAGPVPPQSGTIGALTYNVAGLPQGLSGSNPERNIPLISPLLNGYELVLLQEDFAYHEQLFAAAEHPYRSEPKEQHVKLVDDGLNRLSEFPWASFDRQQWVTCYGDANSGASDCLAEKGFSMARTTLGDRVTVDIYNHHAEAGNGPEDDAARESGFDQLVAYIAEHSAGHAVIVGGDTNLGADDPQDVPVLASFKERTGLVDACLQLSCGEDHIDRFFYRSSEQVELTATSWRVADEFVDDEGEPLSDHDGIHVLFAWSTR